MSEGNNEVKLPPAPRPLQLIYEGANRRADDILKRAETNTNFEIVCVFGQEDNSPQTRPINLSGLTKSEKADAIRTLRMMINKSDKVILQKPLEDPVKSS